VQRFQTTGRTWDRPRIGRPRVTTRAQYRYIRNKSPPNFRIPSSNVTQLRQALVQKWNNIPQAEINTLIRFLRQRFQAVFHFEGSHTRYYFMILYNSSAIFFSDFRICVYLHLNTGVVPFILFSK
jgi:hypothetical protein